MAQDSKGGDNFKMSRNFLATDEVPETIFGVPVVQDESQYTEADLEFFREHPEAGGYYDVSDEQETPEEPVPERGAVGAGIPKMFSAIIGPFGVSNLEKAGEKNIPSLESVGASPGGSDFRIGEMKDVRFRPGWERVMYFRHKVLSDILDFSSPQGKRLLTAYPGLDSIEVTNERRDKELYKRDYKNVVGTHGSWKGKEYIWLNPEHSDYKNKAELYDTILHEGINHAIWKRETGFPVRAGKYSDLTKFGYATDLEETIVDLASRRGAERVRTGKGSADSKEFAASVLPHLQRRVAEAWDEDGSVRLRIPYKDELAKALSPAIIDPYDKPAEAPVPASWRKN